MQFIKKRWNFYSPCTEGRKKCSLYGYFESNFQTKTIFEKGSSCAEVLEVQDPGLCCFSVDYGFLETFGEKAVQKHFRACADVLRGASLVRRGTDEKTFALLAFFRWIDSLGAYDYYSTPYCLTKTDVEPVRLDWNSIQCYSEHKFPTAPALLDKALQESIHSILNSESFKKEAFPAEYLETFKTK